MLNAWLTPTPPGVSESRFASWFDPSTLMTEPKLTGIPYAARKTMITPTLATYPPICGSSTSFTYAPRSPRIAAPSLALAHITLTQLPEDPHEDRDQEDRAGDDPEREHRVVRERVPLVPELELERAGDLGEEVEVDERPDDHVEDLLDHVAGEDSRERRPSDDRDVHDERHERAHVRRDDVVQRDAGGVGGEHGHVRDAAGIRVAQDPVPAEGGQHRLGALEEAARG